MVSQLLGTVIPCFVGDDELLYRTVIIDNAVLYRTDRTARLSKGFSWLELAINLGFKISPCPP